MPVPRLELRDRRRAGRRAVPRRTPTARSSTAASWGLIEVAQLENYKGTIWATWDPAAPSFLDYLGGYKLYLDLLLDAWDGREGGTEVIGGVHKWLIPCNWKFPAENFSGDRYHGVSHRSVDMVGIGPSGKGRRDMQERNEARWLDVSFPELGHSMIAFLRPHDSPLAPAYQDAPVAADYFRRCEEERQRRRGEYWRLFGGPGTVFPNMSPLARQPRTLAVWHPRGPHQTEVWRWYLVDADAPAEVKDFLRHYYIRYSGPSGLTEQDDMENWNYAHAASRGTIARQYPLQLRDGPGPGHPRASRTTACALPGTIMDVPPGAASENNQRGFYTRWRQFMEAASWKDLGPRERRPSLARLLLKEEIEQFLYREAELLDERRFEEWLDALHRGRALLHAHAPQRPRTTSPSASSPGPAPTSTGSTRARTRSPGA